MALDGFVEPEACTRGTFSSSSKVDLSGKSGGVLSAGKANRLSGCYYSLAHLEELNLQAIPEFLLKSQVI